MIVLDQLHTTRHHAPVLFNSSAGFSSPSNLADSRQHAAFFASVTYAIGASMVSMVGRSGGVLARAGFLMAGLSTPLCACHPRLAADGRPSKQTWRPPCLALPYALCAPCFPVLLLFPSFALPLIWPKPAVWLPI